MKNLSLFSSSIVLMLLVFIVNPVYADMTLFVSGDSNIANPLTGSFSTSIDTGNQQFFSNVLQGGSTVALLENNATGSVGFSVSDINTYYTSTGVTTSIIDGTVTSLSGIDLFVVVLPDDDFTAAEIAVMDTFLTSGGNIFFLGENVDADVPSGFPDENSIINTALNGLGSSLRIVDDVFDSGFHQATGSQIASDTYTTGVSTFSYAAPSVVSGGTTLFYGTGDESFLAYEVVPVPGAVLLGSIGMAFSGWLLHKRKML